MNKPLHRIRVLIIDDEPLARRWLRKLLADEPDFDLLGECGDGIEAITRIKQDHPDLVFLDVQMPGTDGFGVLLGLEKEELPAIIFVTAFDQYAVEAFRLHALDYLLKPFGPERFKEAIGHARQILTPSAPPIEHKSVLAMLEEIKKRQKDLENLFTPGTASSTPFINRLTIKSSGKISFLKTVDITWIEAAGDYLEIHHRGGQALLRGKIGEMEKKLDPAHFARIHRSTIINLDQVKELSPLFHGDYQVVLQDKTKVTLSRNYRDKLSALFEKNS